MKIKSFRTKIGIIIVVLMLLPLSTSICILASQNIKNLKQNVYNDQEKSAQLVNKQTVQTIDKIQSVVNTLSDSSDVKTMDFDKMDVLMKKVTEKNSIITGDFVLNEKGMQIYNSDGKDKCGDRSDRDYYKAGMDGLSGITDILISKTDNKPTFMCYAPVKQGNNILGVVNIDVDLSTFSDIVKNSIDDKDETAYIVDKSGRLLAHTDSDVLKKNPDFSKFLPVKNVMEKKKGQVTYNGKLATYVPIDKTNWGVVIEKSESKAFSSVNRFLFVQTIVGVIALIAALIVSKIIADYITVPLIAISKKIELAAHGNLAEAKISGKILKNQDEFGHIANDFNGMIAAISSLIKEIKSSNETIVTSSSSLENITAEVSSATSEVSLAVDDIAKGAQDQAKQTESGVSKVGELADRIDMVSGSIEKMKDISSNANNTSDNGLKVVEQLLDKTSENEEANKKVSISVEEVHESVNSISEILNSMNDIAEQTNLLALNAAIEASRAGEAGKGFAVVAEEVRVLSEQSTELAGKIGELITGVQRQSEIAVEVMRSSQKITAEQNNSVRETGDMFESISKLVKELLVKMSEIADYSSVMRDKKDEIVEVITSIASSAEESSATTEEVAASTEEQLTSTERIQAHAGDLSNLAKNLEELINKFKV